MFSSSVENIRSKTIGDYILVEFDDFVLCVVHGFARPGHKNDTSDRLEQSKLILEALSVYQKPKIVGGDFNLNPDTKSIEMFEENGYLNLIKDYEIETTRNHYSWEQAEEQAKTLGLSFHGRQKFADYCFVSKDVKVNSFEVPMNEVSDHLPLILDFEI